MTEEMPWRFFVALFGILGLITMMIFLVYNQRDMAMQEVCFNTYVTDSSQHAILVDSFPSPHQRGFPRCAFGNISDYSINNSIKVWKDAHYQNTPEINFSWFPEGGVKRG